MDVDEFERPASTTPLAAFSVTHLSLPASNVSIASDNLQPLMMMAGLGIICWMLMRSRTARRRSSRPQVMISENLKHNANASTGHHVFSGTGSLGAPPDVLKWQVELHDLGRELKAELDSKLMAVRSMTLSYDQASQRLNEMIRVAQLSQQGWTDAKIAQALGLSQADVRPLLELPEAVVAGRE